METVAVKNSLGSKILAIFGSGEPKYSAPSPSGDAVPGRQARHDLLQQIMDFLMGNDLAVSPANLLSAYGALSGTNARLARRVVTRRSTGQAIDQAWLDKEVQEQLDDEDRERTIERMMAKLDGSISAFSATTRTARTAAASYSDALQEHVDLTDDSRATGQVLTSLADLAKAMLERNRQVEDAMRRSELEAEDLRKNLEKAQRDAEIDHLTGLPNRRAFEGLLETCYREAQAAGEPLCVAFCDIDHFKRINDTHGHETGDRVIQKVAQVLARTSSENCHVARHGGEEFVMLFRGLTREEAFGQLEHARRAVSERNLVNRSTDQPIGKVTFSGGLADVFGHADPRDALRAADAALYRAKESGRNRIETE